MPSRMTMPMSKPRTRVICGAALSVERLAMLRPVRQYARKQATREAAAPPPPPAGTRHWRDRVGRHAANSARARAFAALIASLMAAGCGENVPDGAFTGAPGSIVVNDGDTISVPVTLPFAGETPRPQKIRLIGFDAPELHQSCCQDKDGGGKYSCGLNAKEYLANILASGLLSCFFQDKRGYYGRLLAHCFVDGEDIGASMVARGHAVDAEGDPDYRDDEAAARAARRGLHRGAFVVPRDWRRGDRLDCAP